MKDDEKWRCCGCGEPVGGDGFPTCECPTNVLYKRGTNEHALKPRPCATCGAMSMARFPRTHPMKDDAERARALKAAANLRLALAAHGIRFSDASREIIKQAMLAFAQQPEGWVLVPKVCPEAWLTRAKKLMGADAGEAQIVWSAMLDAAPIPGEE